MFARKQQDAPRINYSNQLTRNLVAAYTGASIFERNIVTGELATIINDVTGDINVQGRGFLTNPDNLTRAGLNDSSVNITGSQNRTVLMGIALGASQPGAATTTFCCLGTNSTGTRWELNEASNNLRIEIQGSGYTSSLGITNGQYHQLGVVLDGSTLGSHRLFVDGAFENTSGAGSVNTGTGDFRISDSSNTGGVRSFDGSTIYCYVWDRALSDAEVLAIYANPWQIFRDNTASLAEDAAGTNISVGTDALLLTEYAVSISAAININVGVDALALTEHAVTVTSGGTDISVGADALVLTEHNASISAAVNINVGIDALVLTEHAAGVSQGLSIDVGTDALALTGYACAVSYSTNINCGVDALALSTFACTVSTEEADALTVGDMGFTNSLGGNTGRTSKLGGNKGFTRLLYSLSVIEASHDT